MNGGDNPAASAEENWMGTAAELQDYVEALLGSPSEASARGYWLVPAAGVQLALPQADVVPCEDGAERGDEVEPETLIDVTRLVTGRAAEGERRRFAIPAFPRYRLEVEAPHGAIRRADDEIRWRTSVSVRPWLAGMIAAPAAAVVSVARLVEEHVRRAGEHRGE